MPLLVDSLRRMPFETVPDSAVATHPILCACDPCRRRPVELRRQLKRRRQTTISSSASTVSS